MSDLAIRVRETEAILARIASDFTPAVFASSLAAEDMVLTDLILKAKLPIGIFSLETGRLHKETLAVLDAVKASYGYDIALYKPQPEAVDDLPVGRGDDEHGRVQRQRELLERRRRHALTTHTPRE